MLNVTSKNRIIKFKTEAEFSTGYFPVVGFFYPHNLNHSSQSAHKKQPPNPIPSPLIQPREPLRFCCKNYGTC